MTAAHQELPGKRGAMSSPQLQQLQRREATRQKLLPPQVKGFMEGGVAALVAGVCTHPLDLIKVRMQLLGEGAAAAPAAAVTQPSYAMYAVGAPASRHGSSYQFSSAHRMPFAASAAQAMAAPKAGAIEVASQIVRSQGVSGLFSGVSATALRQVLYSSSRMGIYEILKGKLESQQRQIMAERGDIVEGPVSIPIQKKVGAALFSGAVGAAIGNPADLAMVRMQADGRLQAEARRNYRSVGDALSRIVKEEGVLSLWKGCGPTVYRAMAVTVGQLAVYDQAKEAIQHRHLVPEGMPAHIAAAFTAAVAASLASNPFDVLKTRLMNMKPDPVTGAAPYSGALDCAVQTIKAEGPLALYKGLVPTIARQGPFSLILFVTLEQVRILCANV